MKLKCVILEISNILSSNYDREIDEALEWVTRRDKDVMIGCITNLPRNEAEKILRNSGYIVYFTFLITLDNKPELKKPSTWAYQKILREYGFKPEEVISFESDDGPLRSIQTIGIHGVKLNKKLSFELIEQCMSAAEKYNETIEVK